MPRPVRVRQPSGYGGRRAGPRSGRWPGPGSCLPVLQPYLGDDRSQAHDEAEAVRTTGVAVVRVPLDAGDRCHLRLGVFGRPVLLFAARSLGGLLVRVGLDVEVGVLAGRLELHRAVRDAGAVPMRVRTALRRGLGLFLDVRAAGLRFPALHRPRVGERLPDPVLGVEHGVEVRLAALRLARTRTRARIRSRCRLVASRRLLTDRIGAAATTGGGEGRRRHQNRHPRTNAGPQLHCPLPLAHRTNPIRLSHRQMIMAADSDDDQTEPSLGDDRDGCSALGTDRKALSYAAPFPGAGQGGVHREGRHCRRFP